jgi:hypothetical protein
MHVLGDLLKSAFRPRLAQVAAALAAFLAVLAMVYGVAIHSEAYEFADGFVAQDPRITTATGPQSKRTLRWYSGFDFSYGDREGEASMTVQVTAQQGAFDVPLVLRKKEGRWDVVSAKLVGDKGEAVLVVQ